MSQSFVYPGTLLITQLKSCSSLTNTTNWEILDIQEVTSCDLQPHCISHWSSISYLIISQAIQSKSWHCAARIHSWNPKVQARASAHHHGQFQLGCVCFVRTIRTSVIISALHKLRNTRNSASAETVAAAVVRTWARRPKANAAISQSWGSVASSILISGWTAPHCTMCTWRTQHFPDFKNQLWNKFWKSAWHSVSLHWLLHFSLASILHKTYNKSHSCFELYSNMQHGPKGVRKNTNLHLALRICCCKLAQQESCLPLAFLAPRADNNQIYKQKRNLVPSQPNLPLWTSFTASNTTSWESQTSRRTNFKSKLETNSRTY